MEYATIKSIHIATAAASYVLFVLRGMWMIRESARLHARWVKIVPHVVDTVLLASAIALAIALRQYPFVSGWLTAKVVALVVYIVLGAIALKRGRSRQIRIVAWIAAQAVFLYIVSVALTRNAAPFL